MSWRGRPGSPRSAARLLAMWLVVLWLPAAPVRAGTLPVAVRYGDHPGFGRIVFDGDGSLDAAIERKGDRLTVRLGIVALPPGAGVPRNVVSVTSAAGLVTIDLAAKAGIRRMAVNNHLVIDVLDPTGSPEALPARRVAESPISPIVLRSRSERRPEAQSPSLQSPSLQSPIFQSASAPAAMPTTPATFETAAVIPTALTPVTATKAAETEQSGQVALAAEIAAVPDAGPGHRLSVPFASQVGAAAFRSGADAVVVFDARKPIDLQRLKDDPVFGAATVQLLPAATILRLKLPLPAELRLARQGGQWSITAIGGDAVPPPITPIVPNQVDHRVLLAAAQPGLVVSVPDPATGGVLMVGTQREPGQGVAVTRRAPDFTLWPSWQGVVVQAVSDTLGLQAVAAGFAIDVEGQGNALASSPPDPSITAVAEASRLSRVFDLPNLPTEALLRRMQGAVVAASTTPVRNRLPARQAVAQAMVALGMGPEAEAVLGLASAEDARAEDDPASKALSGVAGILAGRAADAAGLDDSRLNGSDEIAFWRAVRLAMRSDVSPPAAQIFANTLPLLRSYPSALQQRLLPIVAETMATGGELDAAAALLAQQADDTTLDLARALLLQAKGGDPAAALAIYDRLSHESDRLQRLRASRNAAELRLSAGLATPAQTAETLGRLLYAWRGDEREIELRLRTADLLAQSEQWRQALQLLRDTKTGWPDRDDMLRARLKSVFANSLQPSANASLTPFDFVALAGENADLMPDGEAGQKLAERIGDQLLALDLPERAIPSLEKMTVAAPPGVARSTLGGRLAALRLDQGNTAGAIEALTSTVNDSLPASLLESRTLVFAKAVAKQGDLASATNALRQLDSAAGDRVLADLTEAARQWPEATQALRRYAARTIPPSGPFDEQQGRLLLRLASAAAEAGDGATLARLRVEDAARFTPGKTSDLFNLLTAQPVRGVGDLARGAREMALARSAPGALPPLASR